MFGTGNFIIGKTLYAFRDGETIEVMDEKHIPLLEAEANRRKVLNDKMSVIDEKAKA